MLSSKAILFVKTMQPGGGPRHGRAWCDMCMHCGGQLGSLQGCQGSDSNLTR